MNISGLTSTHNLLQRHNQAGASSSGSEAASSATDSIANTGSVSAGNMNAFFQSFSADLQSMLSQVRNTPSSGPATQTGANQPAAVPHHHHRHPSGGSMQGAASQMTAEISQNQGGGTQAGAGIANAASVFAADVMQALRAYGSTAPAPALTGSVA